MISDLEKIRYKVYFVQVQIYIYFLITEDKKIEIKHKMSQRENKLNEKMLILLTLGRLDLATIPAFNTMHCWRKYGQVVVVVHASLLLMSLHW